MHTVTNNITFILNVSVCVISCRSLVSKKHAINKYEFIEHLVCETIIICHPLANT